MNRLIVTRIFNLKRPDPPDQALQATTFTMKWRVPHGSTYGGNPLACTVASAALDVLVDEHLVERSAELGAHFNARLTGIQSDKIKAIRCRGLWAGIDLTEAAGPAKKYCLALQERGMLCKDTHVHTLRLAPPLVITKEQIDWAVDQLAAVLA